MGHLVFRICPRREFLQIGEPITIRILRGITRVIGIQTIFLFPIVRHAVMIGINLDFDDNLLGATERACLAPRRNWPTAGLLLRACIPLTTQHSTFARKEARLLRVYGGNLHRRLRAAKRLLENREVRRLHAFICRTLRLKRHPIGFGALDISHRQGIQADGGNQRQHANHGNKPIPMRLEKILF